MAIKTIFFDFDGVIADSLDVKSKAFYRMYEPYGQDIAQKVEQHHLDNGGMSRFEKFRYYHKTYLGIEISDAKVQSLATEFSDLVVEGVINAPFVAGIVEFLENNYIHYNCLIITGTPTDEMIHITDKRGIKHYFKGIYGSPQNKDHWVKLLLSQDALIPSECLFVGDALSDYHAAVNNKVPFILREHNDNTALFSDKEVIRITDFNHFEKYL